MSAKKRWDVIPLSSIFLALAASSCAAAMTASDGAIYQWSAAAEPTVFEKADNAYEGTAIGSPDVVLEGGAFTMAYAQGGRDGQGRIGIATSADGKAWTRAAATVLEPEGGAWDSRFLDTPCILKVGSLWYLYFYGNSTNDTPGGAIGLATSTDCLSWTRVSPSPVLERGGSGAWDGLWVESPSVRWDGTRFQMIYTGVDASWIPRLGHATSPDGLSWTKDDSNPVLSEGSSGQWDSYAAAVACLVPRGGAWDLFYCGLSTTEAALKILSPKVGHASSADLSSWTRDAANPVLTPALTWNLPNGPYNPGALYDSRDDSYWLWYETGSGFGLARARRK